MLPRFTPRVQRVVKLADEIAREHNQDYVGTEHILLALAREGAGQAARVLDARGITFEQLKAAIDRVAVKSDQESVVFGQLPGTPHFKNVVARAIEVAGEVGHKDIGTGHLMLGLMRETGSIAATAMRDLGLESADILREIRESPTPADS